MKRQHWLAISLMMIATIGLIILVQPVAPAGAGDGGGSVLGGGGGSSSALSIAGNTFVPRSSSTVFQTTATNGVAVKDDTDPHMHAPLNLPDGAQITSLTFYYYDNNDPGCMKAHLIRNDAAGGRASLIGVQSPYEAEAGSHYGNITFTPSTPEVVDNDHYNYEIEVLWTAASTTANELWLMGVKVVYSE